MPTQGRGSHRSRGCLPALLLAVAVCSAGLGTSPPLAAAAGRRDQRQGLQGATPAGTYDADPYLHLYGEAGGGSTERWSFQGTDEAKEGVGQQEPLQSKQLGYDGYSRWGSTKERGASTRQLLQVPTWQWASSATVGGTAFNQLKNAPDTFATGWFDAGVVARTGRATDCMHEGSRRCVPSASALSTCTTVS